tara:strand:- start:1953 stop:2336 length:384 start_codon:yes stop_codon:yes gene_type:complete
MGRDTKNSMSNTVSIKKPKISWAEVLKEQIIDVGYPEPELEYKFHPTRKWRFDLAFPKLLLAIEIEGGVWISGRHNRASGFIKDMEKYNEGCILGWQMLRFTPSDVKVGKAILTLGRYFGDTIEVKL